MPCAPESPPTSLASAFAKPAPADLRERIQSWGVGAAQRLRALGLTVAPATLSEVGGRRELVFRETREPREERQARKERSGGQDLEAGASLALSIDTAEIQVSLLVPPGALDGLRSHLTTPERSLQLTTALESLPEQFTVGLAGRDAVAGPAREGARIPASSAATDEIRALLDGAAREQAPFWLGWVVPRDLAVAHALLIDEQLEDALVALGCVFTMVLSRIAERSVPIRLRDVADKDRREHARGDDDGGEGSKRRVARGGERERERERGRESDVSTDRIVERDVPPIRPARSTATKRKAVPNDHDGLRRRPARQSLAAPRPIEKGTRVRVLDGPFTGKSGVVQEVDGKGGARVMLGLLALRLDLKDLARCVEGRDRPLLASSHRKPLPARS